MSLRGKIATTVGACAFGLLVVAACDSLNNLGNTGVAGLNAAGNATPQIVDASQGRKNALRLIGAGALLVDVRQFPSPPPAGFFRCDPLGLNGGLPWPSRIGGPITLTPGKYNVVGASPDGIASEYDELSFIGETGYALGLRTPVEPNFPQFFSQVEFNFRAVNPFAFGHAPGFDYVNTVDGNQAKYPSNDDVVDQRSLINLAGGDVAIWVQGINFFGLGAGSNTFAAMNFLGPTGWVLFLRDNAFQSGRFYNITGALKGGPRAFEDTPPAGDEGAFESAQVNGDNFDANSTPAADNDPLTARIGPCPGVVDPGAYGRAYAFVDRSNIDELGVASPGEGGFVLVIRRQAFNGKGVVINPNVPGPAPAVIGGGDVLFPAPGSGYNEPAVLGINHPGETVFAPSVPGVHEIGVSVFFTHTF